MKTIQCKTLNTWINNLLQLNKFKDYCPNGLQIKGRDDIRRIIVGVSACTSLLEAAINKEADAVIVHHGIFWKNNIVIDELLKNRISICLRNNLNLLAYHLPLDAHPVIGNNKQFGQLLEFDIIKKNSDGDSLLMFGRSRGKNFTAEELNNHISEKLNRSTLLIGNKKKIINEIAWCTGGAQNKFLDAIYSGADAYITGEVSEPVFHIANELDAAFICAGHHATERYGIKALGLAIKEKFDIQVEFIDIDNPI